MSNSQQYDRLAKVGLVWVEEKFKSTRELHNSSNNSSQRECCSESENDVVLIKSKDRNFNSSFFCSGNIDAAAVSMNEILIAVKCKTDALINKPENWNSSRKSSNNDLYHNHNHIHIFAKIKICYNSNEAIDGYKIQNINVGDSSIFNKSSSSPSVLTNFNLIKFKFVNKLDKFCRLQINSASTDCKFKKNSIDNLNCCAVEESSAVCRCSSGSSHQGESEILFTPNNKPSAFNVDIKTYNGGESDRFKEESLNYLPIFKTNHEEINELFWMQLEKKTDRQSTVLNDIISLNYPVQVLVN